MATIPVVTCLVKPCSNTLMYYVGAGQYLCWVHLLSLAKGAAIPDEIMKTQTCGVPNAN